MFALIAALAAQAATAPAKSWPTQEADVVFKNFGFRDGESLSQLRIHYTTLGAPHRNRAGEIDNAVMILHGTGGDGHQFLSPQFAGELYGPGQPLDIGRYWIILPDNIGHGSSSKPSDGLRMRFPRYGYTDMVVAQHRLLTQGLGIRHLRLIVGTSMGCMHSFLWGEMYPGFARALMPLACEPIQVSGRNALWRQMAINGIEADPAWKGGDYRDQPELGLRIAASVELAAELPPLRMQKLFPTHDSAAATTEELVAEDMNGIDANDTIYQIDSSRTYDPWPLLERITVPVAWVNSADDLFDPPSLPYPALAVKRMARAKFRLIPESSETHGHGTFIWASYWKADLVDLLRRSAARAGTGRR